MKSIEYGIKQVHKLYLQRGLKTTFIHADSEFEPLCAEMSDLGISLNRAYNKEHIPEIEQIDRTVKERTRSSRSSMNFKRIFKSMIFHIVSSAIFLDKLFSFVKTWHRTVHHKRPQKTSRWDCIGLQDGFPHRSG